MRPALPLAERAALVKAALHNLQVQRFACELNLAANPGATERETAKERAQLAKLTRAMAALERQYRAELAYTAPAPAERTAG